MPVFCSIEIIERMCKIYSVKNMKDLSSALGVGASTVSNWNQRNMIPFDVLLKVSSEKGVSLDWLVFGNAQQQSLSATEKMLLGAFNELDEKQQLQAVLFVGLQTMAPKTTALPMRGINTIISNNLVEILFMSVGIIFLTKDNY